MRARAGTLSRRPAKATSQVHMVGVLIVGFLRLVAFLRSKYLSAGLHGSEGSAISCKNLDSFQTGIVEAYWPKKLPMANSHATLSLLDAPYCCDPDLYIIWGRFRQMRRYLAYHKWLDLAAAGRPGHGHVNLLLKPAGELGFAWASGEEGRRPGMLPLRMFVGPYQHFKTANFSAWRGQRLRVSLLLVRGFGVALYWTLRALSTFFSPLT